MVKEEANESLITRTSNLRDDLLIAVAKLEQYANALQVEVLRLKQMAIQQREEYSNDKSS